MPKQGPMMTSLWTPAQISQVHDLSADKAGNFRMQSLAWSHEKRSSQLFTSKQYQYQCLELSA